MRVLRVVSAAAAVVALASLSVGAASASSTKVVRFAAAYKGTAVVKVTDNVADITATGTGTASQIGAGKVTGVGKGDTSVQPCVPFVGPGSITGKSGKVTFTVLPGSTGCGDEEGNVFSISGKAKVVKATGKLAKAKGTLKFTGVYDRGAGTFSIKFSGKLTQ